MSGLLKIRPRDFDLKPAPEEQKVVQEPEAVVIAAAEETNSQIERVVKRLDDMALSIASTDPDLSEVEALTMEIQALRTLKEMPWEFNVKRAKDGRIKTVLAKQVRPRLIA